MSPIDYVKLALSRYADFSGRSRRMEYWMFYLAYVIVYVIAAVLDNMLGTGFLALIVVLALIVPLIACGIRRMHDQDKSGWWILVPIVSLIFMFLEGTKGPNQYGPDPKGGL